MKGYQYRRLVADAKAFAQAAWLIEREIEQLKVKPADQTRVGGTGWPSHEVWESLKSASHFNLGIALELKIKCLLTLEIDRDPPQHHNLAELYDKLSVDVRRRLNELFQQAQSNEEITLEAFVNTATPQTPEGPANPELNNLKDFCIYFDEDMKLSTKRYTWETLSKAEWRHYLSSLDWMLRFLDMTEKLAEELAREGGLVK